MTGGRGADAVLDAVGGPVFKPALKSLGLDGRQIAITSVGNRRVEFDLTGFIHNRQHLLGVDTAKLTGVEIAKLMDELRAGFEHGYFRPSVVKTWSLDHAVEEYAAVEKGDASAKHVIQQRHT